MYHSVNIILTIFVYGITAESYPKVYFPKGTVTGKYTLTRGGRKIEAFYGLPYAQPPVGDLRFQPPQPDDMIIGDMLAQTLHHPCTQPDYTADDSEDCLFLNVFTPNSKAVKPLPVYVYIFGGIYYKGSANDVPPDYMLDENILLVTINYRIGLLGFLSTGDSVVPGNMAFKDIRCGLRWVKENIWRFGGDPKKVTIGGSSSGASTVHTLMLYLGHEGLFRSGICESGVPFFIVAPPEVRLTKDRIANITQCPSESDAFINCLKKKSSKDFVDIYTELRHVKKHAQNCVKPFAH